MDGPTIGVDASGKRHRTFSVVALWICIAAVSFGLIDVSRGFHRIVPTCASAAFTCYFANKLWPHRWWQIGAGVLGIAAISAFFVGVLLS
jgi:hypothetical protein